MSTVDSKHCAGPDCDRPRIARGLCTRHYRKWARDNPGCTRPSLRGIPAIDRLLSQCVERDGCWVYAGQLERKGYVRLRGDVGPGKVYGHRLAWEFFIGPWPEGLTFGHLCRIKACVNPWHGEPVPSTVNSCRAGANIAVINAAKTQCPQGHPLSGDNLRYASRGRGRVCRTCRNEANRRYRQAKAAA